MAQDQFTRSSAVSVGSTESQWNALGALARWFTKSTSNLKLEDHSSVDVYCADGSRIERDTVREAREALRDLLLEPARVNVWGGDLSSTYMHCSSDFRDDGHRIDVRISSADRLTAGGLHGGLDRYLKAKSAQARARAASTVETQAAAVQPSSALAAPGPRREVASVLSVADAPVSTPRRRAPWNHPWALALGGPVISGVVLALILAALLPR